METELVQGDPLFRGMLRGNYHRGGIKTLRLLEVQPAFFLVLTAEFARLAEQGFPCNDDKNSWTRPFGECRQYSLFNRSGRFDDLAEDYDPDLRGKRFPLPDEYPSIAALLHAFPDALNFRLNVLPPGSGLSAHEEQIVLRDGRRIALLLRFHLPLLTNPRTEMVLDEELFRFDPGYVYYFNHGCTHASANHGDEPRLHLVWDMPLTRRVYRFMFSGDGVALPPFLGRLPAPERGMTAYGRVATRTFETCRRYPAVYRRWRLHRLGVPLEWFRRAYTLFYWLRHRRPRRVGFFTLPA